MPRPQIPDPLHLDLKRDLPRRRPLLQRKLAQPPQHVQQDKIRHRLAVLAEVVDGDVHRLLVREFVRKEEDAAGDGDSASAIAYVVEGDADGEGDGAEDVIGRHYEREAVEIKGGAGIGDMVGDEVLRRWCDGLVE